MKLTEHQRLLLPYDPAPPETIGGRLPSIPQLWERASLFFSRVITHIGSTASFSQRMRLTRSEKKEVLGWLEPVEKLARSCLLVRAFSFLMMTPEGRRLMRDTPKIPMPEPKRPDSTPARITRIPIWHTHAPYARMLAERCKIEQQKAAEGAARDKYDPANWGGAFRVLGWSLPEGQGQQPPKKKLPQWAMLLSASLDPDPVGAWRTRSEPRVKDPCEEQDRPALVLARRIETLARVIANPAPAVKRLARYIARLPREALEPLKDLYEYRRSYWLHTGRDALLAADHACRAACVYCALDTS
jgi:hypothetical protein